jgi:hypothetical protein
MRAQSRGFDHDRDVEVANAITFGFDEAAGILDEVTGGFVFILGVSIRKVGAQVAKSQRAQQGFGHGMEDDVPVGMGFKPNIVVNQNAADP